MAETLYHSLETLPNLNGNILYDDRVSLTIGRRQMEARCMGYPYIIILGKKATEEPPLFEIISTETNKTMFLSESDLLKFLSVV